MDSTNPFYKQVSLLVRLLPIIGQQPCFALLCFERWYSFKLICAQPASFVGRY